MPAPYLTARQILETALADDLDPLEHVDDLADGYGWSVDTHAVAILAVAREARRDVARLAAADGPDRERRERRYRAAERMTKPETVARLEAIRDALDDPDRLADILGGHHADPVSTALADAVQVDHLDDDQAAEVLAILERAGY